MNGGTYQGSTANYSETHLVGTDCTLITPTPPAGKVFLGWYLVNSQNLGDATNVFVGNVGGAADHYLLTKDTIVYACYVDATDLGITANDIYGTVKTGAHFMASATVVNHTSVDVIPSNNVKVKLQVYVNGASTPTYTITPANAVVVVPGNSTQLVWADIDATSWNANNTYQLVWSLDFSAATYTDAHSNNNVSKLNAFKPNTYSVVTNTERPEYSTTRPSSFNANKTPDSSSNMRFEWEYWTYENNAFKKNSSNDQLTVQIILKPENESGLRTYDDPTKVPFGVHNYTTRSGYGLSMHTGNALSDSSLTPKYSYVRASSTVGKLQAIMTFPEYNYSATYDSTKASNKQAYTVLDGTAARNSDGVFGLRFQIYSDYQSDDPNDKVAHYTPMWLPGTDSKPAAYTPVTYISGLWTPLGELQATVQQGQYASGKTTSGTFSTSVKTNNEAAANKLGIYTNSITIKGSLYDDLYINP